MFKMQSAFWPIFGNAARFRPQAALFPYSPSTSAIA
jgi:hypothetical protein